MGQVRPPPRYCLPRAPDERTHPQQRSRLSVLGPDLLGRFGHRDFVLDGHTSMIEGSIGAIQRRLMVADRDHERAVTLLREATEPPA